MTGAQKHRIRRPATAARPAPRPAAGRIPAADAAPGRRSRDRRDREKIRELAARNASLTAERDKLLRILNGMDVGIHIVDRNSDIIYANRALVREFGRVNGRKCHAYFSNLPDTCPWCERDRVLAGATVRGEWQSAKSGKTYDRLSVPIHIADGSLAMLDILQDITRHKKSIGELSRNETRLRSISAELLRGQEAERARISRRLHDEFGQALGALKLHVGIVRKQLGGDQLQLRKGCSEAIEYLDQVIEDARELSHELCPSILEDLGLGTALRRLVAQFATRSRCHVRSRIVNLDRRLPREAETGLYRIVQAALANVEQHAMARNVTVVVENTGRHIECLVEDDGCGFDRAELESRSADKAMGLAVMRERARMMGAEIELLSRKGAGTRVGCQIPIQEVE